MTTISNPRTDAIATALIDAIITSRNGGGRLPVRVFDVQVTSPCIDLAGAVALAEEITGLTYRF